MTTTASDRPAASVVDIATELGAKAAARLSSEAILWLTTVGANGTPQPNPVWFQWRDGEILVFTLEGTPKLRNIARNPRVSLNFNSTAEGGEVMVLTGSARIDTEPPGADELAAYTAKYGDRIAGLDLTPEKFFAEYPVPIRITPDRLRGF